MCVFVADFDPGIIYGLEAASGEEIEAEVASAFGPFISLLCKDCADKANDRIAVGEDPHRIGTTPDLTVEAFVGVVGPDLGPHRDWKSSEGKDNWHVRHPDDHEQQTACR